MGQSKVELYELVGQMEAQMDEMPVYYDKDEGEFFPINDRFFLEVDYGGTEDDFSQDWEKEDFKKAKEIMYSDPDRYLRIPTNFDIHEWEIMKDFCYTIDDEDIRSDLLNAIHGNGAFRMFKDKISQHGVRQDWFDYKKERFAEIAKQWCEEHDLEYVEDG